VSTPSSAVLLDVEGTTTPIDFVYRVLFPYARERYLPFLTERFADAEVASRGPRARGGAPARRLRGQRPPRLGGLAEGVAAYASWLTDRDRKSTALKALQGRIWEDGFRAGELQARVYDDVPRALERWTGAGKAVAIFSSGSVRAQRMLFAHTQAGRPHAAPLRVLRHHHRVQDRARQLPPIAASLGAPPEEILFVSDVIAELRCRPRRGPADGSRRASDTLPMDRDAPPGADLRPAGLRALAARVSRVVFACAAGLARGGGGGRAAGAPRADRPEPRGRTSTGRSATGRTARTSSSTTGTELFNRPLYGGHTAFRGRGGRPPELALYLPGRGGNLRLGLRRGTSAKWLHRADHIVARYRPGTMRLRRSATRCWGTAAVLLVEAVALHQREALAVRVQREGGDDGVELLFAYGGVTGERGRRDGDIGTEAVPIGTYFPARAGALPRTTRSRSAPAGSGWTSPAATIAGLTPAARRWRSRTRGAGTLRRRSSARPPRRRPRSVAGHVPLGRAPMSLGLLRALDGAGTARGGRAAGCVRRGGRATSRPCGARSRWRRPTRTWTPRWAR
jgi:2,3-diketo-5-methylthio-1-phosphopentane phosphatase